MDRIDGKFRIITIKFGIVKARSKNLGCKYKKGSKATTLGALDFGECYT